MMTVTAERTEQGDVLGFNVVDVSGEVVDFYEHEQDAMDKATCPADTSPAPSPPAPHTSPASSSEASGKSESSSPQRRMSRT